jgi:hypothetical protein
VGRTRRPRCSATCTSSDALRAHALRRGQNKRCPCNSRRRAPACPHNPPPACAPRHLYRAPGSSGWIGANSPSLSGRLRRKRVVDGNSKRLIAPNACASAASKSRHQNRPGRVPTRAPALRECSAAGCRNGRILALAPAARAGLARTSAFGRAHTPAISRGVKN